MNWPARSIKVMSESVLVGRVSHESNTFSSRPSGRDTFQDRRELFGDEIPDALRDTNSEVGGIIDVAEEEGVELVHTLVADGGAGGPVAHEAYGFYTDYLVDAVREHAGQLDGIVLPLHGAMVPEGMADGEGPLLSRVRGAVDPDLPVVVTLDPHANVTDEMVERADALIAYETIPHVDGDETGRRGMAMLVDIMRGGIDPVVWVERPPVLAYGPTHDTSTPPMGTVMSLARDLETREGVLKVSPCPGFWQADVPEMGFSVVAVADGDLAMAREAAREVSAHVWDRREEFTTDFRDPESGVRHARSLASDRKPGDGPVVVAEMNDNPGGGAPGDGTPVLRALLEQGVTNGGLAIMRDPVAVERCVDAGVGARVPLTLGGKIEDEALHGAPIEGLDGYVKAITDGQYENTGPMMTGVENQLGRAVRLHCGPGDGLTVVLTEGLVQPWDAEIWRHVGVQPERLDVVAVKSAIHFRADYERFASHIVETNGPGLATHDPTTMTFERVDRPKYPVDSMDAADYPDWE